MKIMVKVHKYGTSFFRSKSTTADTGLSYCMDLVKRCDYENFLCTLLLPGTLRGKAFVLRAFQVELAQVKEVVTEKNLGLIRMQFWTDAINQVYKKDDIPPSKVLTELNKLILQDNLQKRWFTRILEARRDQLLSDLPHPSLQHLEDSSEHTHSSLYYLLLQAAGVSDLNADHTASHLGRAQGLALLCRSIPHHASKGVVYLPQDLMIKHKVSQDDIIRNKNPPNVIEVVFEIASQANIHLSTALSHWGTLPTIARLIFLSATPTKRYLRKLQKCAFNAHHPLLRNKDSLLPFNLVINKLKKKL